MPSSSMFNKHMPFKANSRVTGGPVAEIKMCLFFLNDSCNKTQASLQLLCAKSAKKNQILSIFSVSDLF